MSKNLGWVSILSGAPDCCPARNSDCPGPQTGENNNASSYGWPGFCCLQITMSRARPVYKQARLMITKRVHGREFRLRPGKKTNTIIRYVVAVMRTERFKLSPRLACKNKWRREETCSATGSGIANTRKRLASGEAVTVQFNFPMVRIRSGFCMESNAHRRRLRPHH